VKAKLFYKSCPWAEWWDEFLFTVKPNGAMRYTNAWSFARDKGKNEFERNVIYKAIGPEAQPAGLKFDLDVPWQGDWAQRRSKGFWVDQEGSKAEILREAIKAKSDNLEILKQFTSVPVRFLTQYQRMMEQVVEHFGGQLLDPNLTAKENKRRANAMLYLLARCRTGASLAIDDLAKCLGLHPQAPEKWADLAILAAETASKAALKGQEQGMIQGTQVGYLNTITRLVQMTVNKSKQFDLALPAEAVAEDDDEKTIDAEPVQSEGKPNGKKHYQ
jgi:hypothetical protein